MKKSEIAIMTAEIRVAVARELSELVQRECTVRMYEHSDLVDTEKVENRWDSDEVVEALTPEGMRIFQAISEDVTDKLIAMLLK